MIDRAIFRRFKDGDVIALLPDAPANAGYVMSYMHVGQHSEATRDIVSVTRPASTDDADVRRLMTELRQIGYVLAVRHRLPSWSARGVD